MDDFHGRRRFLQAAMVTGVAWATADLLEVEEALAWATKQAAAPEAATKVLTKAEADAIDALASRILPSVDGRPGAHEAGAVFFIDSALGTFNAGQKTQYVDGVADLNRRAARKWKGATAFATLSPGQQDELIREIEKTPFFEAARFDTIVGTFAQPSWGGNRDFAGWHLIGLEHQPAFQAPFGYYDAEINRRR
jgi:hypothetical protein